MRNEQTEYARKMGRSGGMSRHLARQELQPSPNWFTNNYERPALSRRMEVSEHQDVLPELRRRDRAPQLWALRAAQAKQMGGDMTPIMRSVSPLALRPYDEDEGYDGVFPQLTLG